MGAEKQRESVVCLEKFTSRKVREPLGRSDEGLDERLAASVGCRHDSEVKNPARRISPLRPHDLRHTFAFTLSVETGADAYELERRLEHRSQHYSQRCTNPPEDVPAGYVERS